MSPVLEILQRFRRNLRLYRAMQMHWHLAKLHDWSEAAIRSALCQRFWSQRGE